MIGGERARSIVPLLAATLLCASLLSAPAGGAQRQELPRNDGWVTDLAGLLPPSQERDLEASMESYRRGSGHDVALLTVQSLKGEPIESFALRVARAWKLGSTERNDGALLVVSRDDRGMRIEVGRGLEGTLTDATCGRIIRDVLTPRFQHGDFATGLVLGVEALQHAAGGDFAPLDAYATRGRRRGTGLFPAGLFLLFLLFILLAAARARRSRFGGGSIWPWLFVANSMGRSSRAGWGGGFGGGGGGFGGFGGGGGFSGGGASGRW